MSALGALVVKELRVLTRDRHGLAVLFVMPAVFILIMSFAANVRAALASVQAEYLLEDQMGVPHADAQKLRGQIDPAGLPVDEVFTGAGATAVAAPNAVQQSVPAWLVFAMFFVVLPLGT